VEREALTSVATPKISMRDVGKLFRDPRREVQALTGLNLDVTDGCFVALLGPSGCGKTTVLRIVAGLETPSAGEVLVGGRPVLGPGADRGMVFQTFTCFPWLTVQGNVEYALRLRGIPPSERAARADQHLAAVGLLGFGSAYPGTLSGGMQQRLAIARTLAREPEVLLMDEPFGSLDSQTRAEMQELLLDVWSRTRKTVLFVTHDVEEALFLADVVAVMSRRPGCIRTVIANPLMRPRHAEMKMDTEFVALRRHVTRLLRAMPT
jgi:NitT/TauT family transport system ATP-binding protein